MANIKRATMGYGHALVAMGSAMHMESPRFSQAPYSTARAMQTFQMLLAADHALVLVAEECDNVVGMLAGFTSPHFFSNAVSASELVVYVKPECRGGSAAPRLIRAFEDWAINERGAHEIILGVSTEVNAERTAEFYERLGYAPSGHTMRKTAPRK